MKIFIVSRLETIDFDMSEVNYGYFSTREKAEREIRLLNQQQEAGLIRCLDENPDEFKITEVELDKGLQSMID